MNGYGELTKTDAELLERVLGGYRIGSTLNYLEIGVWHGETTVGIINYCKANRIKINCTGIDVNFIGYPGHLVVGKSEDVWPFVTGEFDIVFVDGCHCLSHVICDAVIYGAKVKPDGFMLFHDTAPHLQHVQTNEWVHPDSDSPAFKTATLDALKLLGWPNNQWSLWGEVFDPNSNIGGMTAFQKQP